MRVKLSYTVEEEDILPEAAKILGLSADDMKQAIDLFQGVQSELSSDTDVNTNRSLEMLEELRKALLAVDTRVTEVVDIIEGFEEYRSQQRAAARTVVPAEPPSEE
tara:strand:+ start:36 stop:353 length:318 start_codon:yes stop_codon:yes gene_type:complete